MRKLILKMSMSRDGFVAGPNGEMDWVFRSFDESTRQWEVDGLWQAGLHIMGARTFADMCAWWPTSTEAYAPPMNQIPKAVFTRRALGEADTTTSLKNAADMRPTARGQALQPGAETWSQPYVANGELRDEVMRLKQAEGKPILAHGGASFARSLVVAGLVDEFRLLVHPVVLGTGLAIFDALSQPLRFTSAATTVFPSGAVAHVGSPTT